MESEHRRSRRRLLFVAAMVVFVMVMLWPPGGDADEAPPPRQTARESAQPTDTPTPQALPSRTPPARVDSDDGKANEDEPRDATGEPLSAGPAKKLDKPLPAAKPGENVPSKQETDQAFARVLARIGEEIEAAKAKSDQAEARRLEVRRGRLRRKRAAKMAEDRPELIPPKPKKRPAVPPRPVAARPTEEVSSSPLELSELHDDRMVGTMQVGDTSVVFAARQTSDQVFALEIRHGEVTLTGECDYAEEIFLLDGFVTETGRDIVLDDRNWLIVEALGQGLSASELNQSYRPDVENMRGIVYQTPGSALSRLLAVWKTGGVDAPENYIKAVQGGSVVSLCGWLTGFGVKATHDCWDCWDDWDGWSYVNIGPQGSFNCYPDSCSSACPNYDPYRCGRLRCEESSSGPNGSWQWGSDADKYGACTVWDTNAYTRDCLYADHCVRGDHWRDSHWCMDEFSRASDDQAAGTDCIMNNGCSGSCGGYSSSGACYCDSSCDSFGDCCMDKVLRCG